MRNSLLAANLDKGGSKRVAYLAEIGGPQVLPIPSQEELAEIRKIELGTVKVPRLAVDSITRSLILLDIPGVVVAAENLHAWRILKLGTFSSAPVDEYAQTAAQAKLNAQAKAALDSAFRLAMRVPEEAPGEEEEAEPEEEEEVQTAQVPTDVSDHRRAIERELLLQARELRLQLEREEEDPF